MHLSGLAFGLSAAFGWFGGGVGWREGTTEVVGGVEPEGLGCELDISTSSPLAVVVAPCSS